MKCIVAARDAGHGSRWDRSKHELEGKLRTWTRTKGWVLRLKIGDPEIWQLEDIGRIIGTVMDTLPEERLAKVRLHIECGAMHHLGRPVRTAHATFAWNVLHRLICERTFALVTITTAKGSFRSDTLGRYLSRLA